MNKDIIKELFDEISTGTGLSYSGDRTISRSEAQSILDYITHLQQENENLKTINEELNILNELHQKLNGKLRLEINRLTEELKGVQCMDDV